MPDEEPVESNSEMSKVFWKLGIRVIARSRNAVQSEAAFCTSRNHFRREIGLRSFANAACYASFNSQFVLESPMLQSPSTFHTQLEMIKRPCRKFHQEHQCTFVLNRLFPTDACEKLIGDLAEQFEFSSPSLTARC